MTDKLNETIIPTETEVVEEVVETEVFDETGEVLEATHNEEAIEVEAEFEELALDEVEEINHVSVIRGISFTTFQRMTKKNQQYLMAVEKQLSDQSIDEETYSAVFNELAETLIEGQKTGQTAKQLYGTPTECATIIRDQHFPSNKKAEDLGPSEPWHIALDGALLLGSIYTLITGISLMNANSEISGIGILTLIVNYIVAGFAMLLIAQNLPKPDAPKGQKGYLKYFGMSTLAMVSWVAAVSLVTAFAPPVINPLLPSFALIVIGLITIALRFYLKKRYNIRGGVF